MSSHFHHWGTIAPLTGKCGYPPPTPRISPARSPLVVMLLILLLCCALSPITFAAADDSTMTITKFPWAYNIPLPFSGHVNLLTPRSEWDKVVVTVQLSSEFTFVLGGCTVTPHTDDDDDETAHAISIEKDNASATFGVTRHITSLSEISGVTWSCSLQIAPPTSDDPQYPYAKIQVAAYLEAKVSVQVDSMASISEQIPVGYIVPNFRSITHQLRWAHPDHPWDSQDGMELKVKVLGMVAVDYFIFIPGGRTSDEYMIQHPWLLSDLGREPMHIPRGNDMTTDLRRFYQQIPYLNGNHQLRCTEIDLKSDNHALHDSLIHMIPDEVGRPKIVMNSSVSPWNNYFCRFTLYYPPDVLFYSLYENETPAGLDGITSFQPHQITGIQVIPSPKMDTNVQSFIWVSPHHRRYYNDFEFSIAVPKYYYGEFQDPFLQIWDREDDPSLTIQVDVLGYTTQNTPTRDSIVSIQCYTHLDDRDDDGATPIESSPQTAPETISLLNHQFSNAGLTCRVKTTSTHNKNAPRVVSFFINGQQHKITVFNSFHQAVPDDNDPGAAPRMTLTLYDPVPPSSAPSPSPLQAMGGVAIPFSTTMIDQHAVGSFHLQYTPIMPSSSHFQQWFLHLLFPQATTLAGIADRTTQVGNIRVTLSNGHVLVDEEDVPIEMSQMDVDYSILVENPDEMDDIFIPGRGIRVPTIEFPLNAFLDSTQPLLITVQFRTDGSLSEESINVYPMLLPSHFSSMRVYEPQFALITRVLDTPLTGYSYRCVAWDKMAGNYIYNPPTGGTPSVETFAPCPSPFDPATGDVVNVKTNPLWRRVEYPRWTASHWDANLIICLYELAAVCVTPSATHAEDGTYDVHPLADCPSFLGAVHAVPCNLVDNNSESDWGYSIENHKASYDRENHKLRLSLLYNGDPRATATVLAAVHHRDDQNPPSESFFVLTNTFLPFAAMNSGNVNKLGEAILDLPWFLGDTLSFPHLSVQVRLNGSFGSDTRFAFFYNHPQELGQLCLFEPQDDDEDEDEPPRATGKTIDPMTHLCVCGPGTVPESIDHQENAFLHPSEVKCLSVCGNGTTWDAEKNRCDCLKSEYSDIYCTKPVPKVDEIGQSCHVIPPNVVPPFLTVECGYGMYTNTQCNQCECFKPWGFDESGQCLDCHDLKSTCIPNQTSEISFEPKYCRVGRCLCEPGFYGAHCEHRVMYGTIHYRTTPTAEQLISLAGTVAGGPPFVIPRGRIREFQTRLAMAVQLSLKILNLEVFVQQGTQVLSDDKETVITTIVYGLRRLDLINTQSISDSDDDNDDDMWFPLPLQNQSGGAEFSDIYYAWEQMQANYKELPVANDRRFGQADSIASAYDPHCVANAYTHCPDGEDNLLPPESQVDEDELEEIQTVITNETTTSSDKTTTYIIIGVVVGVVVLAFVGLIVAIMYCKKHEKACFDSNRKKSKGGSRKSKSGQDNVELASQTASTASPSGTLSTSNHLPTQVAVDDPTLPADWIALEDKSTGKIYYSNKVTMESTWHHPTQPKEEVDNDYGW